MASANGSCARATSSARAEGREGRVLPGRNLGGQLKAASHEPVLRLQKAGYLERKDLWSHASPPHLQHLFPQVPLCPRQPSARATVRPEREPWPPGTWLICSHQHPAHELGPRSGVVCHVGLSGHESGSAPIHKVWMSQPTVGDAQEVALHRAGWHMGLRGHACMEGLGRGGKGHIASDRDAERNRKPSRQGLGVAAG